MHDSFYPCLPLPCLTAEHTGARENGPLPLGEGDPLAALSPAAAGRVTVPFGPRQRQTRDVQKGSPHLASADRANPSPPASVGSEIQRTIRTMY